jgi:predicted amidohydrolase
VTGKLSAFTVLSATLVLLAPLRVFAQSAPKEVRSAMRADAPPRKVVVGTMMKQFWYEYEGLDARLAALASIVDRIGAEARHKYSTHPDLAVITEYAVTGESSDLANRAVPLVGRVLDVMGAAARRNSTYVVFGMILKEDDGSYSNAAALLDRQGKLAGIYRKVHAVADMGKDTCEGGVMPGRELPVFECDVGKLAIAICFDMSFDDVWEAYRRKGAEIVVWPTQSPQTIQPRWRALENGFYIVSSTWRNNASIFDPTGAIVAQLIGSEGILVEQIDLTYQIIGWQPKLQNGKALSDKYAGAVGYRYSEAEDCGIFWSNDPNLPIMKMVRELGLELWSESLRRNLEVTQRLRGGPAKMD